MDIGEVISRALEMPCEVTMNLPKVTLCGKSKAHIENYTALLEYRRDNIKLKYQGGVIEISGSGMEIKAIGEENMVIFGTIDKVKLI